MTKGGATAETVTLRDIADMAGVARPVVTVWRSRPMVHGQTVAFPAPVATVGRVERFDRGQVLRYLTESRRGTNPEASLDGLPYAVPEGATLEDIVTLLCLRVLHGDDLDGAALPALAAEVDADDAFLRREVEGMQAPATSYVDGLMSVSYGPDDALDRLVQTRIGRGGGTGGITAAGVSLISAIVGALIVHGGPDVVDLADGSGGTSELAVLVGAELGRPVQLEGTTSGTRGLRRLALLRGLGSRGEARDQVIRLDALRGLTGPDALDRVDEVQLGLGPGDVGVVLGPASVLCDAVRDQESESLRDEVLRRGHLRAAVRLPRGLFPHAPRQASGLWVITPEETDRIAVADLSDLDAGGVAEDLATDVVHVMTGGGAHRLELLRDRQAATVIASGLVVARGVRALPHGGATAADASLEIDVLVDRLGIRGPMLNLAVVPVAAPSRTSRTTVGGLRDRRLLRMQSGSRIDPGWSTNGGTVRALTPDGRWSDVTLDPLDLEARAPRARRTESGDVVFTSSPPAALVDASGGHVVPSPARILRLADHAPIGPHALAAQVNALPRTATDPLAWPIMATTDPALEEHLGRIDSLRRDLEERLRAAETLRTQLVDASGRGVVRITTTDPSDDKET